MVGIVGENITLRGITSSDFPDMMKWQKDNDVVRYDPSVGSPIVVVSLSIDTLDGIHIGQCSLYDLTAYDVQLGIRIGDKNYWNMGYGTEAVELLSKYGFETMNVNRIWLKVLPENIGAIRCYEKCGYRNCGALYLYGYNFITMELWR